MIRARALGIGVLGLVLSTPALHGQTAAQYRDFQLGSDLATVAALTGVAASVAKIIHSRPAMRQELQWRRPYAGTKTAVDPVEQIGFSFYNDQLFRLIIGYGRDQTEGGYRMIVTSVRLNALARTAEAQAVRLDERDAPQRERARQKKEAEDERTAKAKARLVNKAAFKP